MKISELSVNHEWPDIGQLGAPQKSRKKERRGRGKEKYWKKKVVTTCPHLMKTSNSQIYEPQTEAEHKNYVFTKEMKDV
jgi:hypothetical protein